MENDSLKTALNNLERANAVICNLDPAIRVSALEMLKPLILGGMLKPIVQQGTSKIPGNSEDLEVQPADTASLAAFFSPLKKDVPLDNIYAVFAWDYSQHGVRTLNAKSIKVIADQVGLVVPARIDMSLKRSVNVQKLGKGFQLSVTGELFVQKTYGVTKGTKIIG